MPKWNHDKRVAAARELEATLIAEGRPRDALTVAEIRRSASAVRGTFKILQKQIKDLKGQINDKA